MPAFNFDGTEDLAPDLMALREIVTRLKREYGDALTTSHSYIESFDQPYSVPDA